jgi:hypothetical protein
MKLSSAAILVLLLTSGMSACQSEPQDFEELNSTTFDSPGVSKPTEPAVATPLPALPAQAVPLPQMPQSQPVQVGQRPLTNPAHGLPYHDCAIAVGAPLADKGNTALPSLPAFTPSLPNLQQTPAGMKLNPAHGKPGHRCEIAVGAPLS